MIHQFINAIGGVQMLGVISICLFFLVFGSALIWAFCQKKQFLDSMESLPLDNSERTASDERKKLL